MRPPKTPIWWGKINQPMSRRAFGRAQGRFPGRARGQGRACSSPTCTAASQPEHRVNVRVITELAWHNLFVRTLLVRPEADELAGFVPEYHDHRPAQLQGRSRAPRLPQRDGDRGQLHREADPDRRHRICGRDEEARVRPAQLPAPGAGHDADALLGQHRRRTARARCSSACPAPARRRCRPMPAAP